MSQTILVTGASAGIGFAVAEWLLTRPEKHRLIVCCNSNDASLKGLQKKHTQHDIFIIKGDVTDTSFMETTFRQSLHHLQIDSLDAAVINHGTLGDCQRIADGELEDWEQVFRVNLFSYVAMVKELIPYLRTAHGRIILTSSGAATTAYSTWGAYGSSKAALNHLALTLAKEEPDITTVAIRPGMVAGRMQDDIRGTIAKNMDADDAKKFLDAAKNGKLLKAEQPGSVIAALALRAQSSLSGSFLQWNDEKLREYQA